MFKKLKQFAGFKEEDVVKKRLEIHVERSGDKFRIMHISNDIYPTFKLLLQDLAATHNAELEIIES